MKVTIVVDFNDVAKYLFMSNYPYKENFIPALTRIYDNIKVLNKNGIDLVLWVKPLYTKEVTYIKSIYSELIRPDIHINFSIHNDISCFGGIQSENFMDGSLLLQFTTIDFIKAFKERPHSVTISGVIQP